MRFQGDLAKDEVGKLLLTLSLPAMIGMTVQALYNIVDTFWVGKLGPEAIAALTICFPIQMFMIAIASGTGIGLSSIISRRLGENKDNDAVNAAEHGIFIILFYGLFIPGLALPFVSNLLDFFGASPQLFNMCKDYISIILIGSIFLFFAVISGSIIQAEGNSGTPMKSMLTGALLNIVLDPFFIFGLGPFPELGISGAAIATVISQIASCCINFTYIFCKKGLLLLSLRNFKFTFYIIKEIYRVGFPSMIIQITNCVIFTVINRILGSYSILAIAALGIYFRVQSLIFMPVIGLSQGFLPIAGFAFGANNSERLKLSFKKASLVSFIIMLIGFLAFQIFPAPLIKMFNSDPHLVETAVECMRNISILLPFVGPSIMMTSFFQAVGKGFTAMWLSLLRQVLLLLPGLIFLPNFWGIKGVWLAFPISDFISIAITTCILFSYLQKLDRESFPSKLQKTNFTPKKQW